MRPSRAPRVWSKPLSAQAHAPNRPSGADKKQVQNEGEGRPSLFGSRSDRAIIAADRHFCPLRRLPKVAENGEWSVNRRERQRRVSSGNAGADASARIGQRSCPIAAAIEDPSRNENGGIRR